MGVVVTGSLAFDYLMAFPGRFREHFLPERLDVLSVSFLVDSMRVQRGGCAANIAYNLALLGERPTIMATAGRDFGEYRRWLEEQGVDTSGIVEIEDEFTASFFVSTDLENNQIASFYIGAMGRAHELSFRNLNHREIDLVIISPNDPQAMVNYAAECKELGIPYIYDPSQQIIRLTGEQLIEGTRGARMLIVNEYEFEMLKKKTRLSEKALRELAEIVIVTKGERGSTIMVRDEEIDIPPAPPRQVVNPTGVGDAYRAGIIKGFLHNLPWDIVGRMASLSATYVIESDGPQCRRYSPEEFVSRYEQHFGPSVELKRVLLKR